MNVIEKICEKFPIEYNLMPDYRIRSVDMTFGSQVPLELQDKVLEGLDLLGIFVEDMGMPMCLKMSSGNKDCYTLSVSGEEMFHFSNSPTGIPFAGYDPVEAIIWTVYILASRKDWLDGYRGKLISCRCFSARQQAAAMQISNSVLRQYYGSIQDEQIQDIFNQMRGCVRDFVTRAPRFSAQPIEDTVFEKFKGKSFEDSLQNIAERIFGTRSFVREMEDYCDMVCAGSEYSRKLREASTRLVETAYQLPIMAVSRLFTELNTLIDEIAPVSASECSRLLQENVRFSLSSSGLETCFEAVDKAYLNALKAKLEIAFLRSVCDQANSIIHREFTSAKRSIASLRNALGRFCFVRKDSFDSGEGADPLSWKRLSELEGRDVRHRDVSWTPKSLNDLQSVIKSSYSPQLWICSEKLRNQSELEAITDIHLTRAVPVLDEHVVWAIWVDVYKEGE